MLTWNLFPRSIWRYDDISSFPLHQEPLPDARFSRPWNASKPAPRFDDDVIDLSGIASSAMPNGLKQAATKRTSSYPSKISNHPHYSLTTFQWLAIVLWCEHCSMYFCDITWWTCRTQKKNKFKKCWTTGSPSFSANFCSGRKKKISEKLWEYTHFVHLATRVLHGALTSFFFLFFFSPIYFTGATDCADK